MTNPPTLKDGASGIFTYGPPKRGVCVRMDHNSPAVAAEQLRHLAPTESSRQALNLLLL